MQAAETNSGYGLTGALKDSLINVGAAMTAGGVIGAAGGKIASLKPYTPGTAELEFQYADMFQKAALSDAAPEYIKNAGDEFVSILSKAKAPAKAFSENLSKANEASNLYSAIKSAGEKAYKDVKIQESIAEFIGEAKENIPKDGYNKEEILKKIENIVEDCAGKAENARNEFVKSSDKFLSAAKKGVSSIDDIAQAGAKHLRNKSVIGAGIGIGIIAALVLNLLKTNGVLGKKVQSRPSGPANTAGQQ